MTTPTVQPCFTVSLTPPTLPPIFGGLSVSVTLGVTVPPLNIPCCPLSIPLPSLTVPVVLPGINVFISAINAALNTAFAALPQIQVPSCKL